MSRKIMLYCFDRFTFDPLENVLCMDGKPVQLSPQPAKVLALLISQRYRIVKRQEIRKCLWQEETTVDFEMGINTCLRQIRTALGDDASRPRFIETVPRKGYHFICAVRQSVPLHRKLFGFILPAVVGTRLRMWGEQKDLTSS